MIGEGQGAQQHRVSDGEDRDVGAEPERENGDGWDAEREIAKEPAPVPDALADGQHARPRKQVVPVRHDLELMRRAQLTWNRAAYGSQIKARREARVDAESLVVEG